MSGGEWPEKVWLRKDFSRGTWSAKDFDPSDPVKAFVPGLGANSVSGPYIPAERLDEVLERLEERLKDERSQTGTMHTWRASAFGDAIAEVRAIQAAKGSEG